MPGVLQKMGSLTNVRRVNEIGYESYGEGFTERGYIFNRSWPSVFYIGWYGFRVTEPGSASEEDDEGLVIVAEETLLTSTQEGTTGSGTVSTASIDQGNTIVGSETRVTRFVSTPLRGVVDFPMEVHPVADRVNMNKYACSAHEEVDRDEELFPDGRER